MTSQVRERQEACEEDLKAAEPALEAAEKALNTLNKENLSEMKAFANPLAAIVEITAAVMVLFPNKVTCSLKYCFVFMLLYLNFCLYHYMYM